MIKVGVFDSGIGGLTVLSRMQTRLPNVQYIYYADLAHVPYGEKKPNEIRCYMDDVMQHLVAEHGADLVLLACNTATSVAAEELRQSWQIPIVGMEPAVKPALQFSTAGKRIVVTATDLTLRLEKLKNLISFLHADHRIQRLSLQKLVAFAEAGQFDGAAVHDYLEEQFSHMDFANVDALVLGCTHFIYYYPMLRRLLPPHVSIVDGNEGTVRHAMSFLTPDQEGGSLQFVISGRAANQKEDRFFRHCIEYMNEVYRLMDLQRG